MPFGRVKWFDAKKGYGFLTLENSEKDVFLHVTDLEKSKFRKIRENQKIQFEIKEEQGKLKAINLKSRKKGLIIFTAGWSSLVARQAHNLKVEGSNPSPATK